jgi:YjjG family noncanonical pyrimidine nucleotidase
LFDYDQAEAFALKNSFAEAGLPFIQPYLEAYRQINHDMWLDFEQGNIDQVTLRTRRFELLFAAINMDEDPQNFSARYLVNLARGAFLIDGAEALVRSLSGRFNLAIITNGLADVQRPRLARSSIHSYIEAIIISEEVGAAKPDPKIFDIAFARMDHPGRDEVLIIGDSLTSDMQGGHNYGIDTCWFNPQGRSNGRISTTFEIQRLAELPKILGVAGSDRFADL